MYEIKIEYQPEYGRVADLSNHRVMASAETLTRAKYLANWLLKEQKVVCQIVIFRNNKVIEIVD